MLEIVLQSPSMSVYLPILLLFIVVLGFVVGSLFISYLVGPKRHATVKDAVFECGIESVENARVRFSVKYALIAILFVLFDVEIVFFYPWAVNFKWLGWSGFLKMGGFVAVVVIGLLYMNRYRVFKIEGDHQ
ncbi:NADH-quinone oxidoreductase subunit A [bacterium]|nr:NADH-quinone oxidoreductase subunit A [bacterium]